MISLDPVTHTYSSEDGQPYVAVSRVLEALKLTPPFPEEDPKGLKEFGSAIHRAVELASWDNLDMDPNNPAFPPDKRTHPELIPFVNGFLEKKEEMRIRPIKTELRVWDGVQYIAGTLDFLGLVYNGDLAIIDYKSGTPPPCCELQTAGYVMLLIWMYKNGIVRGGENGFPDIRVSADKIRRFSMKLTPNRAIVKEYTDDLDLHAWEGAVSLYKWLKERRKT